MARSTSLAPFAWYPLGMGVAIATFELMRTRAMPLPLALYTSVALVALAVLLCQIRFPRRADWIPRWPDVKVDLMFVALVQVVLPRVLAIVAVLALARGLHEEHASPWWPHGWALYAQVAVMVLAVDFLRYWLHRACHRWGPLWQLHAVHHSPRLLYSLNAARFHPFEKMLHFCADTMPFLALGVAPDVIAGYFVVYAANGFFQHSNIELRYGWLNYVVGSAETHRWHHARDSRAADCNFGSTTVVWDVVFGSWRLPRDRAVGDVGIADGGYPTEFAGQLLAPFRGARARRGSGWRRTIADLLVQLHLRVTLAVHGARLAAMTRDPMRVQRALLRRILRDNAATAFGLRHGFAAIEDVSAFTRSVPVSDFEALRPYIDAEIAGAQAQLTKEAPSCFVRTSGSTGKPKDIPLVPAHLAALRRVHATSVAYQYRQCPAAFSGRILAIVSPAREGTLARGQAFGSASGIVAGSTPASVLAKFVLPAPVLAIADSRVKYLLILRLALAARDVSYIGAANPTTLLTLMRLYRDHSAALIDDVRHGTFCLMHETPADVRSAIARRLVALPERADELLALHARHAPVRLADLWPDARLVVTWTCGSAGSAVEALRRELSSSTRVLELGYVASEFRGTITLGRRAGSGLPTLDTHFFEFCERERWDRGEREFLTLDRVRKGTDYYVIVTTRSGLYRYFINDVVRVTGFLHRTPLLRFVQKGKGVTNITGEKLCEGQVLDAVRGALATTLSALRFVTMLADEQACGYDLYVECDREPSMPACELADAVDTRLAALNVEYAAKRESARLRPLRAHWLRQRTGERYKDHCVAAGQREGQFKPTALAYRHEFDFPLARHVVAP